ncbi:MAG TPA: site-2 protease family protein [Terracidiphilus sp.]|nr:site-2 protease family protein [Terracidiphilus sp.]
MPTKAQGSIHLFRVAGIDLYLHWSWFVVALYEIQSRNGRYSSIAWNVLEYLALFAIVLLHEFGHALACRQVGGTANRILLWPFGGVAYVNPPQRPGATLWSIAAGPLVNVALFPILLGAFLFARSSGWALTLPDAYVFFRAILAIDVGLFVFNMLPVYPLDGGQILRSLLWFVLGRARSLLVATVLGFAGIIGLFALAFWAKSVWSGAIAVFMLLNCWGGLQHARSLLRIAKLPRRPGFVCPSCRTAPPIGPYWGCRSCGKAFDTFETRAVCPHCSAQYTVTTCLDCGVSSPLEQWAVPRPVESAAYISSSSSPS